MPINDPTYPDEAELNIPNYSHVTSAYCENVDLAFDDDPTTYALFVTPTVTLDTHTTGYSLTNGATAATVAGFSTSGINRLAILVVNIYTGAGSDGWSQVSSISGGGLSWKVLDTYGVEGVNGQRIEVWTAGIVAPVSGATIEVNLTAGVRQYDAVVTVDTWYVNPNASVLPIITNYNIISNNTINPTGSIETIENNDLVVAYATTTALGNDAYAGAGYTSTGANPPFTQSGICGEYADAVTPTPTTVNPPFTTGLALTTQITSLALNYPQTVKRFIHVDFQTDLWLTRIRYLGNGEYAGIEFDSGWDVNPDGSDGIIPISETYLPLNVGGNVYDLVLEPPLLADGVWFLPDYLNEGDGYPPVELNQFQVYYYSEDQTKMPLPTKQFITLGANEILVYPWTSSSTFPFSGANANAPLSIQSLDISRASKTAEEVGGENIYLNNAYEYERRYTAKMSVQRVNMQYFNYLMASLLIVDNAGTANEAQYESAGYNDELPYFTLVGTSVRGDGARTVVLPKCKLTGNLSEMWDRTKLTVFDVSFETVWDTTYITQTGIVGGCFEGWWTNNGSNTPVHS